MTNAEDSTGEEGLAARIRAARDRERALGDVPTRVRSVAALHDRLLGALAASEGVRATGGRGLTALARRHPRLADALRSATEQGLAWRDLVRRRSSDGPGAPAD